MKPLKRIVMVFLFAVATWCRAAKAQDTHVGWIDKIVDSCDGKWRGDDNGHPQPLRAKTDRYRFLYPGESVRCDGSGTMTLQILDNKLKTIAKRDGWCKIHSEEALCEKEKSSKSSDSATTKQTLDEDALKAFGRAGGRQRGFRSAIFSPAPQSVVRADKLVVRWNEIPGANRISLRLSDKYHGTLWEQAGVEAGTKQKVSPEARQALINHRNKGGANPYTLVLTNGGIQQSVQFSILSADEEHALDQELTGCVGKRGLLLFACRAYAFTHRQMWNDAAAEYEAALELEPASRELLVAALTAEHNIGNAARASELKAVLPAGTELPE
jgi:hypothetical protein